MQLASLCHHLLRLRVMPIVIFLRTPCFLESSNTYEAFKNTYWQESSKVFDYTSQKEPLITIKWRPAVFYNFYTHQDETLFR
ncbi:hypothetical protein BHM03_00056616 [Ensete ventricosum]|nr:hypothetical protein BHM03_00056616 [Ensete ventricosum]